MTEKHNSKSKLDVCCFSRATLDDVDSDEAAGLGRKAILAPSLSAETLNTTQCINQIYRKSLRLTSEQIVRDTHTHTPTSQTLLCCYLTLL